MFTLLFKRHFFIDCCIILQIILLVLTIFWSTLIGFSMQQKRSLNFSFCCVETVPLEYFQANLSFRNVDFKSQPVLQGKLSYLTMRPFRLLLQCLHLQFLSLHEWRSLIWVGVKWFSFHNAKKMPIVHCTLIEGFRRHYNQETARSATEENVPVFKSSRDFFSTNCTKHIISSQL